MNPSTQSQQPQPQQLDHHDDDPHSKKRTRVTPTQLSILEDTFSVSPTPDNKMRKHLAQKLQMPEQSIQIWFQNRRAKVKMLQRRTLLREEQEMTRAKLYAEAAAAAAASRHYSHSSSIGSGAMLTPASSSSSSFWYGTSPITPYPHYPSTTKLPIQRSWSLDPTIPPPPPPLLQQQHQHYYHQSQHPPYIYAGPTLAGETKELYYHGNISPSPTPNPMGDLSTETFKSFSDTTFIDNTTPGPSDSTTTGFINVNAVTIGTWHRMKMSRQDLLCSFQLSERTFEWHIRDSNYHFKMIISFDLVASLDITILDNGIFAQMDLKLNEPPLFFMENMDDLTWIQCSDFTEGMQATCNLHHTLRGLASDLRQELLGMISLDQHLCQVIRFPMASPITELPLVTAAATSTTINDDITSLDPSSLMSWRHHSLPLHMNDGEWSQSHATF
ncbi:unnamed protein product [Absidia cylindrospora]